MSTFAAIILRFNIREFWLRPLHDDFVVGNVIIISNKG